MKNLDVSRFEGAHCLLIDEAQFLSGNVIEQLKEVSNDSDIPVICYGLRTDFRTQLFSGSKRLVGTG